MMGHDEDSLRQNLEPIVVCIVNFFFFFFSTVSIFLSFDTYKAISSALKPVRRRKPGENQFPPVRAMNKNIGPFEHNFLGITRYRGHV